MKMSVTAQRANVSSDVVLKHVNGKDVAEFGIAVDEGKRDADGMWQKIGTRFADVEVWGTQARNLSLSVKKGDPVIIGGTATLRNYETREGLSAVGIKIVASVVGPDFSRCTAKIERIVRMVEQPAPVEPTHGFGTSSIPEWGTEKSDWTTPSMTR